MHCGTYVMDENKMQLTLKTQIHQCVFSLNLYVCIDAVEF